MNYREMNRVAGDPVAIRNMAGYVTASLGERLSPSEREFLEKLAKFDGPDLLSMRQREWLDALRSRATRRAAVKGYRASVLIKKLWELRLDLEEDDEEFVKQQYELLQEHGANLTLSDGQWRYVFALCHQVGEIEPYVAME